MDMHPRDLPVFGAPVLPMLLSGEVMEEELSKVHESHGENIPYSWIARKEGFIARNCNDYDRSSPRSPLKGESQNAKKSSFKGNLEGLHFNSMLGHSMKAVSLPKGSSLSYSFVSDQEAPAILRIALIPTHPHGKGDVRYAVSIDGGNETVISIKEAYKTARTNLVFSLASAEKKIVVVTSCSPSEGKSTNCLNLAISMAETGASVLLIDSDMRKPVQHSLLMLDNKTGLSSILAGISYDVSAVINKGAYFNLDVITSGPIPPNPAELISSDRMDQLLDIVGKHYDYVFIDTPPANVVTDSFLYSERTAGIVFVIKENSTTHIDINEALKKATMSHAKILGFLKVNCAGKSSGGYKYNYKYKYKNYSVEY